MWFVRVSDGSLPVNAKTKPEAFDGGFREDGSPDHAPPLHRQRRDLPASREARHHHLAVVAKRFCGRVRAEVTRYPGFVEELLSRRVAVPRAV